MPDIGNTLREARIRRGLTIAEVEAITKIRGRYLQALEENDFEVIPGPAIVKGFLRTYAVLLKLDADALIAEYRSTYEPPDRDEANNVRAEATTRTPSRVSRQERRTRKKRLQRGYILAAVVAVAIIALLAWFGSGRGQEAATLGSENLNPPSTASASSPESNVTQSVTVSPGNSSAGATSATTASTAGVVTTTGRNVTLVVGVTEGSCWLVVKEDSENGAELYAGTLSAGGQQTFDGARRYWMMAGRPEVLAVTINGTAHTLSSPAGAFVITESGIERTR